MVVQTPGSNPFLYETQPEGPAMTVQAPNSDVILHVPKGVRGVLLGNIHTNNSKFAHLVQNTECIVSPISEYFVFPPPSPQKEPFKLEIPHIVEDIQEAKQKLRVQVQEKKSSFLQPASQQFPGQSLTDLLRKGEVVFTVKKSHVEVLTMHFTTFIVSAELANCCWKNVKMLIFSLMDAHLTTTPVANLSIHLASTQSEIKDYLQV